MKKTLTAFLALTLTIMLTAASTPTAPKNVYTPAQSIASLGDSLNVAANACGEWVECLQDSWTTGQNSTTVESFADKLALLPQSKEEIAVFNNAKANTTVEDLNRQALLAVNQEAEFITILAGANDACSYHVEDMTPPGNFRFQVGTALRTLEEGLPYSKIFIASIPNVTNLWQTGRQYTNFTELWDEYRMCHSLMKNPNGFTLEAIERRKQVEETIINYNLILAEECSKVSTCLFDNNALYNHNFTLEEISPFDGFHPSLEGQAKIAHILWNDFVKVHAQILRGTSSSSSPDAPLVVVLNPKDGQQVSGNIFRMLVQVRSTEELTHMYADTQLGAIDLVYDETLNLWFLDIDTTLAPSGLKTTFTVVAVDAEDNVGVSEEVTVQVNNPNPSEEPDTIEKYQEDNL